MFTIWFVIVLTTAVIVIPILMETHSRLTTKIEVEYEYVIDLLWGQRLAGVPSYRWPFEQRRDRIKLGRGESQVVARK